MNDYRTADLIGDIYDAGLNQALWSDMVGKVAGFVGAQAGGLVWKDSVGKLADSPYNCGVDPHYVQLYTETYSKFDPLEILPRSGQVASIPDLVCYDDYCRGRFTQEWLWPQGWVDIAMTVLDQQGPNSTIVLALIRSESAGMVDGEMRRRTSLVAPHLRRALLIAKAMDHKQSDAAAFSDTLDALSAGVFLVETSGRIVHANDAGHEMLYANDFLRSIDGCLSARDPQVNQSLRESFAAAATSGIGSDAIAFPLTACDGECYITQVLSLTSGARRAAGMEYGAVAAVFVRKAGLENSFDLVAQTYKLTPTESRVLLAIVDVGGVPETAAALGLAETTVKTHLYRLFDKTCVNRQADLVKLVAGFSNPLVS